MRILLTTPFDNGHFDDTIGNYTDVRVQSYEEDRSDQSLIVVLQWGIWTSPDWFSGIKTERKTITDADFFTNIFELTLTAGKALSPASLDSGFLGELYHKAILTKIQANAVALSDASLIGTVSTGGYKP